MKRFVWILALISLSACGGGGSSSPSPMDQLAGVWNLSGNGSVTASESSNPSSPVAATAQFSGSLYLQPSGACSAQVLFTLEGNVFIGFSFNGEAGPQFTITEALTGPEVQSTCAWDVGSQGRANITFLDFKPNIVLVVSFQPGGSLEVVSLGPISLTN